MAYSSVCTNNPAQFGMLCRVISFQDGNIAQRYPLIGFGLYLQKGSTIPCQRRIITGLYNIQCTLMDPDLFTAHAVRDIIAHAI